jgi:hypothetical protein
MTEAKRQPTYIEPLKDLFKGTYRWPGLVPWILPKGGVNQLGVVATEPLMKGSRFEYFGKELNLEQFEDLKKIEKKKQTPNRLASIVHINKDKFLDAYHSDPFSVGMKGKYLGGCVNEPDKGTEPNCQLTIYRGHAYIVANRDILVGEELTMNYGTSYKRVGYSKS